MKREEGNFKLTLIAGSLLLGGAIYAGSQTEFVQAQFPDVSGQSVANVYNVRIPAVSGAKCGDAGCVASYFTASSQINSIAISPSGGYHLSSEASALERTSIFVKYANGDTVLDAKDKTAGWTCAVGAVNADYGCLVAVDTNKNFHAFDGDNNLDVTFEEVTDDDGVYFDPDEVDGVKSPNGPVVNDTGVKAAVLNKCIDKATKDQYNRDVPACVTANVAKCYNKKAPSLDFSPDMYAAVAQVVVDQTRKQCDGPITAPEKANALDLWSMIVSQNGTNSGDCRANSGWAGHASNHDGCIALGDACKWAPATSGVTGRCTGKFYDNDQAGHNQNNYNKCSQFNNIPGNSGNDQSCLGRPGECVWKARDYDECGLASDPYGDAGDNPWDIDCDGTVNDARLCQPCGGDASLKAYFHADNDGGGPDTSRWYCDLSDEK